MWVRCHFCFVCIPSILFIQNYAVTIILILSLFSLTLSLPLCVSVSVSLPLSHPTPHPCPPPLPPAFHSFILNCTMATSFFNFLIFSLSLSLLHFQSCVRATLCPALVFRLAMSAQGILLPSTTHIAKSVPATDWHCGQRIRLIRPVKVSCWRSDRNHCACVLFVANEPGTVYN